MKTFSVTIIAVCVMGLATGQAFGQLPFLEDFESLTAGTLDGQGGWTADPNVIVDAGGAFSSNLGAKNANGTGGNFSASRALGVTVSSGTITATALVNAACGSCERGGSVFLSDGNGNVLEVQALGGENHPSGANSYFRLIGPGGTASQHQPYVGIVNGSNGNPAPSFNDAGFVQLEVSYNLNTNEATGSFRDVLDFDGRPTSFGPVVAGGVFPAFDAFDVTTIGFRVQTPASSVNFGGQVDDITVTPEPASAMLLGLGGLLMLRRRSA